MKVEEMLKAAGDFHVYLRKGGGGIWHGLRAVDDLLTWSPSRLTVFRSSVYGDTLEGGMYKEHRRNLFDDSLPVTLIYSDQLKNLDLNHTDMFSCVFHPKEVKVSMEVDTSKLMHSLSSAFMTMPVLNPMPSPFSEEAMAAALKGLVNEMLQRIYELEAEHGHATGDLEIWKAKAEHILMKYKQVWKTGAA